MNVILFGPPGSGKGTQGKLLSEKFSFHYLSSGQLIRSLTDIPADIKKIMEEGGLLPDSFVMETIKKYFDEKKIYDNILFDGTPRSVGQYKEMKHWLAEHNTTIHVALYLEVSHAETIRRLSARRMDPASGEIYNLITNPPAKTVDITTLIHRDDDKPAAIAERLAKYDAVTEPLRQVLEQDGILVTIDGEREIDQIALDLEEIIKKHS